MALDWSAPPDTLSSYVAGQRPIFWASIAPSGSRRRDAVGVSRRGHRFPDAGDDTGRRFARVWPIDLLLWHRGAVQGKRLWLFPLQRAACTRCDAEFLLFHAGRASFRRALLLFHAGRAIIGRTLLLQKTQVHQAQPEEKSSVGSVGGRYCRDELPGSVDAVGQYGRRLAPACSVPLAAQLALRPFRSCHERPFVLPFDRPSRSPSTHRSGLRCASRQ